MARRRVYIKPFAPDKTYSEWIEVTDDVEANGLGIISAKLDGSDYDVGVFTNSGQTMRLRNGHGKYSDVGGINSIFQYKRADSLVKVTYDEADSDFWSGISRSDDIQGKELQVYLGLLNDDATVMQLKTQTIEFKVMGLESILDRTLGDFVYPFYPADDKASTLLKTILSKANLGVTQPVMTVDDSRIVPGNDVTFDDISVFVSRNAKDAVNALLLASNSILYMDGTTPVVSGRTASEEIQYNFYGPGSLLGPENIQDLSDIRTGLNRTFNYVSWTGSALFSTDGTSSDQYGVRIKELQIDGITTDATRQSILDALRNEFANPKQEFYLSTPLNYSVLSLPLLSKVRLDYPLVPIQTEGLPQYGTAVYGDSMYPINLSSFQILQSEPYKITGLEIDLIKNSAKFALRRI